jgi:hypothetical protein
MPVKGAAPVFTGHRCPLEETERRKDLTWSGIEGPGSLSCRVRAATMLHTPNQRRAAYTTGVPALQDLRCTYRKSRDMLAYRMGKDAAIRSFAGKRVPKQSLGIRGRTSGR